MRRLSAPGATAALSLSAALLAAGAAFALPPEPASAPKGAHVAAAPPPPAAPANGLPGITPDGKSNSPIDITSEGVEMIQPQHLTIFRGNVEATSDQTRIRTPEMRVFSKPKPAGAAGQPAATTTPFGADQSGGVDRIEATGPFYYITPTENARSDYMVYESGPNTITLTGHVVLAQGKSVGKGDKLIIYRATGQNQLISNSPQTAGGRVRVILYPQQQAAAAPAKPPAR